MEKVNEIYILPKNEDLNGYISYLANSFLDICKENNIKYKNEEDFTNGMISFINKGINTIDIDTIKKWKLAKLYIKLKTYNSVKIEDDSALSTPFQVYYNCYCYSFIEEKNFPDNYCPAQA